MNRHFKQWISLLLIACLLLSGTAFMEEAPEAEEIVTEAVDEAVEEIVSEAVDEAILEETPVELEDVAVSEAPAEAEDFELAPDAAEEESVLDVQMPVYDAGAVAINATNFPDEAFRNYIKSFDDDNNGSLSEEEIENITSLQFSEWNDSQEKYVVTVAAKSLAGIGFLTNLEYLSIEGCGLTSLDLSKNTNLIGVYASQNKLTKLDVSKNTKLQVLLVYENQLTSLDVTKLTELTDLDCSNNQLTSLNVTNCPKLEILYCDNNKLTALDVTKNTQLTYLGCGQNQLTALDVTKCTLLQDLYAGENKLTSINVTNCPKLEYLYVWDNKLTSLDVTKCTALKALGCNGNQLTALDVTKCTKLESLTCELNNIKTLDISKCPTIAANVKGTGERYGNIVSFNDGKDNWWLECDADINLIGGSATLVPTVTVAKSMKYTVNVGVKIKINPNGTAKGYKSSKKSVATVDATGLVTPKAAGKTKITFKVGKKTRTLTLTVKDPTIPTSITLDKSGTITWYKQDALTLNVTLPINTYSGITWKTSNKKVATVSGGKLTFKKAGTVTITATATRGKKKAKVKIKVIDGSKATSIKINTPSTTTLKVGEKLTLTATATIARPADPSKPTVDPKAKWTSSNKKVLTVNKTTGEITAKKPGTATITVTAGSKKKARIKITVIK